MCIIRKLRQNTHSPIGFVRSDSHFLFLMEAILDLGGIESHLFFQVISTLYIYKKVTSNLLFFLKQPRETNENR